MLKYLVKNLFNSYIYNDLDDIINGTSVVAKATSASSATYCPNYFPLAGNKKIKGILTVERDCNATSLSYSKAHIILNTASTGSASRPGIGFQIPGIKGTFLYMDDDGELYTINNSGVNNRIVSTRNESRLYKIQTISTECTLNGNESTAIYFNYTAPDGYYTVGTVGYYTGNIYVYPLRITEKRMDVNNISDQTITFTATITVLFIKA